MADEPGEVTVALNVREMMVIVKGFELLDLYCRLNADFDVLESLMLLRRKLDQAITEQIPSQKGKTR